MTRKVKLFSVFAKEVASARDFASLVVSDYFDQSIIYFTNLITNSIIAFDDWLPIVCDAKLFLVNKNLL